MYRSPRDQGNKVCKPDLNFLNVTLPDYPQVPPALVPVTVRECIKGEVRDSPTSCLLCPPATFSFFPNETQCQSHCPDNADCLGGATMIPELGFWHSAPESVYMAECPNHAACLGDRHSLHACQTAAYTAPSLNGSTQMQGLLTDCPLDAGMNSQLSSSYMRRQCSPGYYGPLCSMCVKQAAETYGRTSLWGCQRCKSAVAILAAFIASNLLVLAFLWCSIHVALKDNEEDLANVGNRLKLSELTRAFTLWLQYTSLLANASVAPPRPLTWLFTFSCFAFSTITSGALSTDCLISPQGRLNPALKRIMLRLSMPWIILVILLLLQLLRWTWQAKKKSASVTVAAASHPNNIPRSASDPGQAQNPNPNPNANIIPPQIGAPQQRLSRSADLKRRSLVTVLVVAFYYYPTMVTDALSFFACYNVDPSSHGDNGLYAASAKATWAAGYWLSDMTVPCFTGAHMQWAGWIGLPFILLTGVGIPLVLLSTLLYHRRRLDLVPVRRRYGFIYQPYRRGLWFWDTLVLLQTFALACAQVLATSLDGYFQLSIMLMILVVGLTVLAHISPFRESVSQHVQVFGMFTVAATATACLYFLDPSGIAKQAGIDAAGILVLILNASFLLTLAVLTFKACGQKAISWVKQMLMKPRKAMQSLGVKIVCCGRRGSFASSSISISMAAQPVWDRMYSGSLPDPKQSSLDDMGVPPINNTLSMQSNHSSLQSQTSSAALLP